MSSPEQNYFSLFAMRYPVSNLSSALPFNANSQIVSLYFQICVSSHMCFVIVYSILGYWNYPLKNIFGVTGCHIANLLGETGALQIQLHSFIMATTRYIFLFHDNLLLKFSLTTNVSAIICRVRGITGRVFQDFVQNSKSKQT